MNVWLCTWNMSNKGGNDDEIRALAQAVPREAEVVVLGLQEAKRHGAHIMERFASYLPGFEPVRPGKVKIAKIKCMTKPLEFGYQGIGVLRRHGLAEVTYGMSGTVDTGGGSGKGGVFVVLHFEGAPVAFISAHLPTGKRDPAGMQLYRAVAALNPRPHATFLMGDLNYRLDLPATRVTVERRFLRADKQKEFTQTDDWVDMLLDPKERRRMANSFDRMGDSSLARAGFVFPFPRLQFSRTEYSYPTYKRESGLAKESNPCYLLDQPTHHSQPGTLRQWILDGYFGGEAEIKKKDLKRGGFDIGWLDRIGVLEGPGMPSAIARWDNPIALAGTYTSDHAPVGMLVDVIINLPLRIGNPLNVTTTNQQATIPLAQAQQRFGGRG